MLVDVLSAAALILGTAFFTAGTIGLIRFPDVRTKLHALTKADNLGLGLVLLGVALYSRDAWTFVLLVLVWLLAVGGASVAAQSLAGVEASEAGSAEPTGRDHGDSEIAPRRRSEP